MNRSLTNLRDIFISNCHQHKVPVLSLLCLSVLLTSVNVSADEKDPINLIAGVSKKYDSNIFLLPKSELSETINSAYAGISLNKQYAQQRFKFDYKITAYRYQNFDYLNFNANEYNAAWFWALTPYLTGSVSTDRTQSAYGFLDIKDTGRPNISTRDSRNFNVDWSAYNSWHLLAGYANSRNLNTQNFQADRGYQQDTINLGMRYYYPSGSAMTFMQYYRKGVFANSGLDPVNFLDNGFSEREDEAQLAWKLTGKSNLNLRAALVSREYDHFNQRDYSGMVGSASYTWTPTGRLYLSLSAASDLSSFQTINSNFTRTDTLRIAPTYVLSEKVTVSGSASVIERSFIGGGVIPSSNRQDRSVISSLNVNWTPLRSVTLGANLNHNRRNSNVSNLNFSDTTVGLSANLFF